MTISLSCGSDDHFLRRLFMYRTNLKHFLLLSIVLCLLLFLSACSAVSIHSVSCIEASLLPKDIQFKDEEKQLILDFLEKYYLDMNVETGQGKAFGNIHLSTTDSIYSILDLYNVVMVALAADCLDEAIRIPAYHLTKEAIQRVEFSRLSPIDSFTALGLLALLEPQEQRPDLLEKLLKEYTDSDSGLLYECNSSESLGWKLEFTAEVISKLKETGTIVNVKPYEKAFYEYYQNAEWSVPKNENDSLSDTSLEALRYMNAINMPIDLSKHKEWYEMWKALYDRPIENEADLLDYIGFAKVAFVFGDREWCQKKFMDAFEHIDFSSYLMGMDPQLAGFELPYIADILTAEQIQIVHDYCELHLQKIASRMIRFSLESNYYGMEMAQWVGFDADIPQYIAGCEALLDMRQKQYEDKKLNLDEYIREIYYYHLIGTQMQSMEKKGFEKFKDNAASSLNKIWSDVQNEYFRDPQIIRMLCTLMSQLDIKADKAFVDTTKSTVKELYGLRNETYSFCELYMIDTILSLGMVGKEDVVKCLAVLEDGGAYKSEKQYEADVATTFFVYAFRSCFDDFTNSADDSSAMRAFVAEQLDRNISGSKGLFEAICLLYGEVSK